MGIPHWLYPLIILIVINWSDELVNSMPSSYPYKNHSCPYQESLALLQFKQMFTIDSFFSSWCERMGVSTVAKTMSWKSEIDCCLWDGVTCDRLTGHVTELDLSCSQLSGYIPSNTTTLFHLSNLRRLNLAYNHFQGSPISRQFFGPLSTTLTHLNLSYSAFQGQISSQISHMSKLVSLDLSSFRIHPFQQRQFFGPLSTHLTHLNLSNSEFQGQISSEISHMSKLVSLDLLSFEREVQLGSHSFRMLLHNLTQLRRLDLSGIIISSNIPFNLSSSLTSLHLSHAELYGKLPDDIFHHPKLLNLDLSQNQGLTGPLPEVNVIACSTSGCPLRFLDLSHTSLHGELPDSLGHLKSLNYVDLSFTSFHGGLPNSFGYLKSLKYVDLSSTNLQGELPNSFGYLKSLNYVDLSYTNFQGELPNSFGYLKSLNNLMLINCKFSGSIPRSLGNLIELTHLNIQHNNFSGKIPSTFSNLKNLSYLDFSNNNFNGAFHSIANLTQLTFLDISNNSLTGTLPSNIIGFPTLYSLDLSQNSFNGPIPSWCFALPSLTSLHLNSNRFTGIPEIQSKSLMYVDLSGNNLHGPIPRSFSKLTNLTHLNLSLYGNNISNTIELDMFANLTKLEDFNISCNGLSVITTNINTNATFPNLQYLTLESCKWQQFPHLFKDSPNLLTIDLSGNQIQGQLSNFPLSMWAASLVELNLRSNLLQGPLPATICNFSSLSVLDLANNRFSGAIPTCLGNETHNLQVLNLRNNGFRGIIPTELGVTGWLETLNLHGNQLEGILPRSLANCTVLEVLDLGNNQINDAFPHWLGTLPRLQVLSLRYNKFYGPINYTAKSKYPFPELKIIDLSNNNFIGFLPSNYFRNFKAMMNVRETETGEKYVTNIYSSYYNEVTVVEKGLEYDMIRILTVFTTIDLSSNKFEGEIPDFIGNLNSLRVLNLSHNRLAGGIPPTLASISVLESLDLSSNKLVGEIPQQLTFLTSLAVLNLSKNHLVGRIPQGSQFNTFNNDSYSGNTALCGFPLSKECEDDETRQSSIFQQKDDSIFASGFTWKVVLMGYGCGCVLGLVMGILMFLTGKPKWFTEIVGNGQHKIVKRTIKRAIRFKGN